MLFQVLLSTRPRQWVKNLFVLAALVFSEHLFDWAQVRASLAGLGCFCLLSGAIYLFNDVFDVEGDRRHPRKSKRPVASGALPVPQAILAGSLLLAAALGAAYELGASFFFVASAYAATNLAYSYRLKRVVLIDVLIVASGFLLRALGGALIIEVRISEWFILCIFTLALFLATVKRRQELVKLHGSAAEHRAILEEYNLAYLDQVISVLTSATIICYALYAMGVGEPGQGDSRPPMQWTIPFVLYGILRYLYIVHHYEGGDSPTIVIWEDRPLQITMVLWVGVSVALLYFY
jgi:4-hydroxybenzoate polyprenyltransferase